MILERNVCLLLLSVTVHQLNGKTYTSYKEDECKIPSQAYIDDYVILSKDAESGLECTIISLYRQCEHVLYRKDTKMCVCTYTYDTDPPSMKDMTLINNMKSGLEDNLQPTRYFHVNKNPVVESCRNSNYTWIPGMRKCIKIITKAMTQGNAKQLCMSYNGHLPVLPTRNINRALYGHLVCKGLTSQFWIGLRRNRFERTYNWIDNTPLTYTDWGPGEPSMVSGEYCARIVYNEEYKWFDRECSALFEVICEEND